MLLALSFVCKNGSGLCQHLGRTAFCSTAAVCCAEVDGFKRKLMNKLAPEAAALKTDWEVLSLPLLQPAVLLASPPSCPVYTLLHFLQV